MLVGRKNEIDFLNKCTTRWLFPFCSHLRKEKDREDISDTGNLWISIHFSTRRSVRRWNEGAAVCVYSFPERCRLWGTRQTSQLAGSFWRTERSDQTVKGKKKSDFFRRIILDGYAQKWPYDGIGEFLEQFRVGKKRYRVDRMRVGYFLDAIEGGP